ncbi:MAG: DNA-processing protein DprA [Pseudomonadota bacterium]
MLEAGELAAWLRLLATPGVGRQAARSLLATFGPPEQVFAASELQLRTAAGALSSALLTAPEDLPAQVDAVRRWLGEDSRRSIITLADPAYPPLLLQTADPPLLLYLQGRAELLRASSIAIVGSRNPSPSGRENAREFAAHFSRQGLTVVSGMAAGIDGAAHEGALEGPGSTVAIVGTGIDRVYPKRHLQLAHRIAEQGLMVSEFPLGTHPLPENFPQRNRIIAGLSLGTLVVEAAVQSGSLITARQAAEMGREVFAIPGSIHAPQARGCHALIKQGAKLVEGADDVLEELRLPLPANDSPSDAPNCAPATGSEDPLLAAVGHDPVTLDALVARTGWPPQQLGARLLELELEGRVVRLPGGLFQRRGAG